MTAHTNSNRKGRRKRGRGELAPTILSSQF